MSCFGNLSKLRETATSKVDVAGLREHKYAELLDKEELGKGAFGAVFTAKLFTASKRETIVVKKSLSVDLLAKKSLVKEARLLKNLCHTNVVMFQGICLDVLALLMEYVYFDFRPIGLSNKVNNLADFLSVFEESNCDGMSASVLFHAALDVASGLKYLHDHHLAHRDLKPENFLVSNHHYQNLHDPEKIESMVSIKPLICKLADFGESRWKDIHTQQILMVETKRIDRGRLLYIRFVVVTKWHYCQAIISC